MLRRLLNIASIVCLVLCVALMGMWVRSSYWIDNFYFNAWIDDFYFKAFGASSVTGVSEIGRIAIGTFTFDKIPEPKPSLLQFTHAWVADCPNVGLDQEFSAIAGFGKVHDRWLFMFMVPYWFVVLATGSLAMAFQLRWPWRFTLRSLFIATSFLAVVLGMIAWLDHQP
jgi:hypothetical protein